MTTTLPKNAPKIDPLRDLVQGVIKAAIVKTAVEMQVWSKIAAGMHTAEEVARAEEWDLIGTRRLLDALCGMRLLAKRAGKYRLVPLAQYYLLPDEPTYAGEAYLAELAWEDWAELAHAIRVGRRPIMCGYLTEECADMRAGWAARDRIAPELSLDFYDSCWQAVGIQARDGLRLLEVACGSGIRSLALARRNPGVHATLLDWQALLEVAVEAAGKLGLRQQVSLLPGDVYLVNYGQEQYDVVWFNQITHFYSLNGLADLLRKSYQALVAGGSLILETPIADEERRKNSTALLAGMEMYAYSAGGGVYTYSEYAVFLEKAGFSRVSQAAGDLIRAMKL